MILVNSNPATIMTDPEFATRTYIEPLNPASVTKVIEREKPDALLPTLGGGTALDLARQLSEDGTLGKHRVELIGADYEAIRRAEDRELFRSTMERAGLRVPRSAAVKSMREAERALPEVGLPAIVRPGFTMGGAGGGIAWNETEYRAGDRGGARGQPDRAGARGGVGDRLGRVRARGDARPQRQRRDRLLDREHRPDGRAHRRQRDRGPAADALGHALPAAARPGPQGDPRGWRRDGRLEHPVRGQPGDRGDRGDRDEPARLALLGAGLEGHGLPDREDRGAARGRLCARGDRQRHHAQDAGELRADDRLRGGEVAALRVREVPGRGRRAAHLDAVGGRGDGDRAHLQAGLREGDALARAGRDAHDASTATCSRSSRRRRPTATRCCSRPSAAGTARPSCASAPGSTPGTWPRWRRWRVARTPRRGSSAASSRWTPARPSSRRRRPTTTRAGSERPSTRCGAASARVS